MFAGITLIQALWPVEFAFSIVFARPLDRSMMDVWLAIGTGIAGYFTRRHGFSVVPLAIGLILGGMMETRLGRSMVMPDEKWWLMLTRPLSPLFLVLTALALFGPMVWGLLFTQRAPLESTGEQR